MSGNNNDNNDNIIQHNLRIGWPGVLMFMATLVRHDVGATLTTTLRVLGFALHFGITAFD